MNAPGLAAGVAAVLVMACAGFFVAAPQAWAAADKDVQEKILKLAAAIKAGKKDDVKKLTEELAKSDLDEVMETFKPRSKRGLGIGRDKGVLNPDGIELQLIILARDGLKKAPTAKEAEALEEMAYVIAAVAEVVKKKGPPGPLVANNLNNLNKWNLSLRQMSESGIDLAAELKKKAPQIKDLANRIEKSCILCHKI